MNCKQARKWMSPYLDSELGQTKTFEVSEHLDQCPACTKRFDAERRADKAMSERFNEGAMPQQLWDQLTATIPARRRSWRFLSRSHLALAACLTIVALVISSVGKRKEVDPRSWIVEQFTSAAPLNEPFAAGAADFSAIADVLADMLGVSVGAIPASDHSGHIGMEMVSAHRRIDAGGHPYVELRLNCCDKPVLLLLGKPEDGALAEPLRRLALGGAAGLSDDGIQAVARDVGGIRTIAVSRHPAEHIVSGLEFRKI